MSLVHDRENTFPAAHELMFRDMVNLEPFRRWRDVVEGDVEGRRLGGEGVEHVLGEVGRNVLWYVVDVAGVSAWVAAENGDARFGVASGHVGREFEVQELVLKGPTIWDGGGWCWTHGKDLEGADPVEGWLGLENDGVGAFPGALATGDGGVVDPRPTVDGEWGNKRRASMRGAVRRSRRDT